MTERKIAVGLYGLNGHQIQKALEKNPRAQLAAVAGFAPNALPESLRGDASIRHYATLDELLKDEEVELVSLCSPRRRDQARDAVRCLEAGKHVHAEKPCAMSEEDLDAIVDAARRTGRIFHESAGTAFLQPYLAMRKAVMSGAIGTVIQMLAQKSYPYHDRRPQDEDIDGGLTLQVGVHALRFIEHITGLKIAEIQAQETKLGNPGGGELRMASSIMMRLENGALAVAINNYLNTKGHGRHGNQMVRIFGTKGYLDVSTPEQRPRIFVGDEPGRELSLDEPGRDYFEIILDELLNGTPMPLTSEEELHPTRMVIRARESAHHEPHTS